MVAWIYNTQLSELPDNWEDMSETDRFVFAASRPGSTILLHPDTLQDFRDAGVVQDTIQESPGDDTQPRG